MLKLNSQGKAELWTGDIKPTNLAEEKCLIWFASLTDEQRAEAVVMARERLAQIWIEEADRVTG